MKPTKKQLENWLDTLNYWYEHIEDYAERYPDCANMVDKFSKIIDEIFDLTKEQDNESKII